ncbi:MAG: hypothetical protein JSU66_01510 [Deltaproteobacteria bacterium]|nr:MAG: hypothetical protein JSU66_01510 [Deltaproteobacteria bacterium]
MGTYRIACASQRSVARAFALAALLAGLALQTSCVRPLEAELPAGALLGGDAVALRSLLTRLERLEGTPLARRAQELATRLEGCDEFAGWARDGRLETLLDQLACGRLGSLPALEALRGVDDLAFVAPVGHGARLAGSATVAGDGSVALDARILGAALDGLAGFVLPSDEPAGVPVLSTARTLAHGRFRAANGLDIAALVPRGSQGDQLFRLKSELFAGAVLDGTWEAAVYLPEEARMMPELAVAFGFRARAAVVAAVESFLRDLQSVWPVHRTPFAVGDREGACLLDLRILPEFAPCYVAAERAIVVGFNPSSVRTALAAVAARDGAAADGGLVLNLGRFREADDRLRRTIAPNSPPVNLDYAWERLAARGYRHGDGYRIRVELRSGAPAS